MLYLTLLILIGGMAGAVAYWLRRRGQRPSGGVLRAEVDQLNLPEAEAAYATARQSYLAATARADSAQADVQLERAAFLLDRIHRLQGMTHGAGARERWKAELQQAARAGTAQSQKQRAIA